MPTDSSSTAPTGQPNPPATKRLPANPIPPRSGGPTDRPAYRPQYERKEKVPTEKAIPVTHLRVVTGKQPESAVIAVSLKAGEVHEGLLALSLRIEIEQLKPTPDNGSPVTAGINGTSITEIAVRLVHSAKGKYLEVICENAPGANGPIATAEKMLSTFDLAAFESWLAVQK